MTAKSTQKIRIGSYLSYGLTLVVLASSCTFSYAQEDSPRVVHVFVALCDNANQGIVPVPAKLGNGDDPHHNLYWGAMYGVKSFFKRSPHWSLIATVPNPPAPENSKPWRWDGKGTPILERCLFRHTKQKDVYLIADAYRGRHIKQAVSDFLTAVSGQTKSNFVFQSPSGEIEVASHGNAALSVYVGHNGLMDFNLRAFPKKADHQVRDAIILGCVSKPYFREAIEAAGAAPLVWTTGLMAPEAYSLEAVLEAWIAGDTGEICRTRAAEAYHSYQKCGLKAAKRLFVTGF